MAKITKITTQKKNKSRYNIFLDQGQGEAYGFSVDEDILIEFHLRKGLELDSPTMEALVQKDSLHKSYSNALHFLSFRMRSRKELQDYLIKKEVEPEHVTVIMDRLDKEGLIDDKEFAVALVRTRVNTTSKGPLVIKKELMDKGVAADIADQALHHYSYEAQYEKALKWVEKKLKVNGKKSFKQLVQSLQQTLIQKGFQQAVIKDVLAEVDKEKDDEAEFEAVVFQGEKFVRKYEKKAEGYELRHKVKGALYRKGFAFELIDRFIREHMDET